MKIIFFLFALLTISTSNAMAEDALVTTCSDITGYEYFIPSIMNTKETGWGNGRINGHTLLFIDEENKSYDIKYIDASQKLKSIRDQGGTITPLTFRKSDNTIELILLANYNDNNTIELYHFRFNTKNMDGHLSTTLMRGGDMIPKAHLFTATCK